MEVLDLTSRAEIDAAAIKACIEVDPALTTKILRVVNSSMFGLSRQVSDLNQALALLGVKPLKLLVLGFSLPDSLFMGMAGNLLAYYWRRTLTRALAARDLSEQYWSQPGDEAFVAGLLRDLGVLVLVQGLGKPYVDFWVQARSSGNLLASVEREAIGFDHRQLTARLLAEWRLPEALVEAVASTGDPVALATLPARTRALHESLHLAEAFTLVLVDHQTHAWADIVERGKGRLTEAQAQIVAGGLDAKVRQLAELLSLEVGGCRPFAEIIDEAHRRLVQVAAESVVDLVQVRREQERLEIERLLHTDEVRILREAAAAFGPRAPAKATVAKRDEQASPVVKPLRASTCLKAVRTTPVVRDTSASGAPAADDPGLLKQLATLAWACRQNRCPLSLLLIELEKYADLAFVLGVPRAEATLHRIETACAELGRSGAACIRIRDATFALVLPDCDRAAVVEHGRELLRAMRDPQAGKHSPRLSIGCVTVNLPPPNFAPQTLIESAERCLNGARAAGGNCVKSIELF